MENFTPLDKFWALHLAFLKLSGVWDKDQWCETRLLPALKIMRDEAHKDWALLVKLRREINGRINSYEDNDLSMRRYL